MDLKDEGQEKVLFVNEFIPTQEIVGEYVIRIYLKVSRLLCYAFSAMFVLWALLSGDGFWGAMALIATTAFFITVYTMKYLETEKLMKAFGLVTSTEGGKLRTIFYDDTSRLANNTFRYEQISKIVDAKLGLYIIIEKAIAIIIKKDSFTVGDYESFVTFLREKLKDNPKALRGLK